MREGGSGQRAESGEGPRKGRWVVSSLRAKKEGANEAHHLDRQPTPRAVPRPFITHELDQASSAYGRR